MITLSYLMNCVLYQDIIKKHEAVTENPQNRIYVNKIGSRIIFKIKTGLNF